MKHETKQLIIWIKTALHNNVPTTLQNFEMKTRAMKLLDSLYDLERHLKRGGYIPDINNTPCKDGDMIRIVENNGSYRAGTIYTLNWNAENFGFEVNNKDACNAYIGRDIKFEKVKKIVNNS